MNLTDVRGWLTEAEGRKLQELAIGKTVLELGSYCGRSTCAMAWTAARIVAVDWDFGDEQAGFAPTTFDRLSKRRAHRHPRRRRGEQRKD